MTSKPIVYCPRCGEKFTGLDAINVSKYAGRDTCYCQCDCGTTNLAVSCGRITGIAYHLPIENPEDSDEPIGNLEDPDYMAI